MSNKKIIHIDMDAFYASIEQRDNPQYRGKPIAVGYAGERGVVAAASYEARKFGVRSAMSSAKAKKLCPELIFVSSRMEYYKQISHQLLEIFHEYTDLVEPLSLDEAFLDVTENKKNIPLAWDVAIAIKKRVYKELSLVASAGISYNKFLAKIASDYRKPDGLFKIHPDNALDFISQLPIESFWGVGKVTAKKMYELGIHNGSQLREHSLKFLTYHFGKHGKIYYNFSRGIDLRSVEPVRVRKSVGAECTLEKDITNFSSLVIELYHIVLELIERIEKTNFKGYTLTLKIKYSDFTIKTFSVSVPKELTKKREILPLAKQLLKKADTTNIPVRLIGVSVSNPRKELTDNPIQLSFDFLE